MKQKRCLADQENQVHIHIGPNGEELKSPPRKPKKADELRHSNELKEKSPESKHLDKSMAAYIEDQQPMDTQGGEKDEAAETFYLLLYKPSG